MKGYICDVKDQAEAESKILNQEWDDILDEYDTEELTIGYDIIEMWERTK